MRSNEKLLKAVLEDDIVSLNVFLEDKNNPVVINEEYYWRWETASSILSNAVYYPLKCSPIILTMLATYGIIGIFPNAQHSTNETLKTIGALPEKINVAFSGAIFIISNAIICYFSDVCYENPYAIIMVNLILSATLLFSAYLTNMLTNAIFKHTFNKNGWTALHFAAFSNSINTFNTLTLNGWDKTHKDQSGKDCWDISKEMGHKDFFRKHDTFWTGQLISERIERNNAESREIAKEAETNEIIKAFVN